MLVVDVMATRVVAVGPDATLKEVVRRLAEHCVTALPVVDHDGSLLGVVSEADVIDSGLVPDPRAHVLPVAIPGDVQPARVAEVMTRHVLTVGPRSDLADAAHLMLAAGVKSLPVVESGRVVGMLSRRDVILALSRGDELIERECLDALHVLGTSWMVRVKGGVVSVAGPKTAQEQELAERLVATVPGVVGVVVDAEANGQSA